MKFFFQSGKSHCPLIWVVAPMSSNDGKGPSVNSNTTLKKMKRIRPEGGFMCPYFNHRKQQWRGHNKANKSRRWRTQKFVGDGLDQSKLLQSERNKWIICFYVDQSVSACLVFVFMLQRYLKPSSGHDQGISVHCFCRASLLLSEPWFNCFYWTYFSGKYDRSFSIIPFAFPPTQPLFSPSKARLTSVSFHSCTIISRSHTFDCWPHNKYCRCPFISEHIRFNIRLKSESGI